MLNTNNNTIKNSNGVNKKIFNLIFISFLFLGLLIIFGIQTVKAYNVGDVVKFTYGVRLSCSTQDTSGDTVWYGAPAHWENKILPVTCPGGYAVLRTNVKITGPGGCNVLGCGADPSLECVTLKLSRLYTGTPGTYLRSMKEVCKKCHEEVVEVVSVTVGPSGEWKNVDDILVAKNKCAKYKAGACDTPCPDTLTCPIIEKDCVIEDKNDDGDAEDEYDYKCVVEVATIAAPMAAAAPIASGGLTAAAAGGEGVILGTALTDPEREPSCSCLVPPNPDPSKDFTPCTKKNPNGCCPPTYTCNKGVCCAPNEVFVDGYTVNYCDSNTCPPKDNPGLTQKCTGTEYSSCCLPAPIQTCGTFNVTGGGTYAYCKDPSCVPNDPKCPLCCKSGYSCKTEYGISRCIPDAPESCLPPDEYFCSGTGKYEVMKKCCLKGELCLHHPNGYPFCLDITKL